VNYVGLENITSNTGEINNFTTCKGSEILSPSSKFETGDILFGRMRPYLNKVWLADRSGVCSGEVVVIRPVTDKVDSHFLHALLLSRLTLTQVVPLQSGTALPRVSAKDVLSVKLPIPTELDVQSTLGEEIKSSRAKASILKAEADKMMTDCLAQMEPLMLGKAS
jgi:restriction endonuclease S subunit